MYQKVRAFLLVSIALPGMAAEVKSPVKSDETVTFFTSAAWPAGEPGQWEAEVRGVIFEKEKRPLLAAGLEKGLAAVMGLEPEALPAAERARMRERIDYLLVDNERGKEVPVTSGEKMFLMQESAPNGHFRGMVTLPAVTGGEKSMEVKAVLREGDDRTFAGTLLLMPDSDEPLVVSDVDDTIKITRVRDRRAAVRCTFCEGFCEVPGMAAVYRRWAQANGAAFYYVTGSPWQLYPPLEAFVSDCGFPAGAWHMKYLRVAEPGTVLEFLGPQRAFKVPAIRGLMERWTRRPFVLVGDTGEQDPEIFGELARAHPHRVLRIFVRNTTREARDSTRLAAAFVDVPAEKWMLFDLPEELPQRL